MSVDGIERISLIRDRVSHHMGIMARIYTVVVAVPLVVFLALVVALNVVGRLDRVITGLNWTPDIVALLTLVGLALMVGWLLQKRGLDRWLMLASALLVVVASVISAGALKPQWVSDFQTMWIRAVEFADSPWVLRDIYDQRIQLFLVPAVRIFGTSQWVVMLLNASCLLVTLALGARWSYRVGGKRAAALFCVIFATTPELLLALGIPTHDLWALPLLAAIMAIVQISLFPDYRTATVGLFSLSAAAFMVLLQVQREIGHVAFVAAVLVYSVILASPPRGQLQSQDNSPPNSLQNARVRALVCLTTLLLAYPLGIGVAKAAGMFADDPGYQSLVDVRVGGIVPSTSRGTYGDARSFADHFLVELDPDRRADFVRDVVASDIVLQPERKLPNALHRMKTLSALGSQTYFYLPALHSDHPGTERYIAAFTGWHAAGFSLLFLLATFMSLRSGAWRSCLFPVLFTSILVCGLVLLGEVQPRYLIPLWFSGSLVIASAAVRVKPLNPVSWVNPAIHIGLLSVVLLTLWKSLDWRYTHHQGRVLEWTLEPDAPQPAQGTAIATLFGDERSDALGNLGFTMQLYMEATTAIQSAHTEACSSDVPTSLHFYYYMPYHQLYALGHFQLSLLVDGTRVWEVGLPGEPGVQQAAVELPNQGCMRLTFELKTEKGLDDISWSNASLTEIYFTRMVETASD